MVIPAAFEVPFDRRRTDSGMPRSGRPPVPGPKRRGPAWSPPPPPRVPVASASSAVLGWCTSGGPSPPACFRRLVSRKQRPHPYAARVARLGAWRTCALAAARPGAAVRNARCSSGRSRPAPGFWVQLSARLAALPIRPVPRPLHARLTCTPADVGRLPGSPPGLHHAAANLPARAGVGIGGQPAVVWDRLAQRERDRDRPVALDAVRPLNRPMLKRENDLDPLVAARVEEPIAAAGEDGAHAIIAPVRAAQRHERLATDGHDVLTALTAVVFGCPNMRVEAPGEMASRPRRARPQPRPALAPSTRPWPSRGPTSPAGSPRSTCRPRWAPSAAAATCTSTGLDAAVASRPNGLGVVRGD